MLYIYFLLLDRWIFQNVRVGTQDNDIYAHMYHSL